MVYSNGSPPGIFQPAIVWGCCSHERPLETRSQLFPETTVEGRRRKPKGNAPPLPAPPGVLARPQARLSPRDWWSIHKRNDAEGACDSLSHHMFVGEIRKNDQWHPYEPLRKGANGEQARGREGSRDLSLKQLLFRLCHTPVEQKRGNKFMDRDPPPLWLLALGWQLPGGFHSAKSVVDPVHELVHMCRERPRFLPEASFQFRPMQLQHESAVGQFLEDLEKNLRERSHWKKKGAQEHSREVMSCCAPIGWPV
ncbi:uncharacterized protein VTP21DRAFT_11011 [Calcarisporiella thermophila]|uniref:uncharacterized protein n=1 Tax=Calcarisporiella thermophila TaxID=911321 RepID=UPI0037443949